MKLTVATCQFSVSYEAAITNPPCEIDRGPARSSWVLPEGGTVPDESQEKAWEAVARRALMDVVAAARSCAMRHGGSYAACYDTSVLFEYGLSRMPNVNYQTVSGGTKNVVFSTEPSKAGRAYQFDPAAGDRIRLVPRFS
jgi:hypothetical protein